MTEAKRDLEDPAVIILEIRQKLPEHLHPALDEIRARSLNPMRDATALLRRYEAGELP